MLDGKVGVACDGEDATRGVIACAALPMATSGRRGATAAALTGQRSQEAPAGPSRSKR